MIFRFKLLLLCTLLASFLFLTGCFQVSSTGCTSGQIGPKDLEIELVVSAYRAINGVPLYGRSVTVDFDFNGCGGSSIQKSSQAGVIDFNGEFIPGPKTYTFENEEDELQVSATVFYTDSSGVTQSKIGMSKVDGSDATAHQGANYPLEIEISIP